jgi:hypothetical protein
VETKNKGEENEQTAIEIINDSKIIEVEDSDQRYRYEWLIQDKIKTRC